MQQSLIPFPDRQSLERVVRIEKNLNSLGFFSPATKVKKTKKIITIIRELQDGVKVEAKATIVGHETGLPTTADLDKYLAFQLIVAEVKRKTGAIVNPIRFTTYHLLKLLGLKPAGKNYREVEDWLDRMSATWIKSEGAVYFAGTRRYAKDRFHVFDRAVTAGQELEDGTVAEQNYVWLSSWQLENLNHNYVLPIDLSEYQRLKAPIAKALVPLLYVWFYATSKPVQKRYRDLCQFLSIRAYPQISRAKEKLNPGLTELAHVGYISSWELTRTVDGADFKLILTKGRIFEKHCPEKALPSKFNNAARERFDSIIQMLTDRGVVERIARRLMLDIPEDHNLEDQIEWIDGLVSNSKGKIRNPAGLYVDFIRAGVLPPRDFVSKRQRQEMERLERARQNEEMQRLRVRMHKEEKYTEYKERQLTSYIANLTEEARAKLWKELRKKAATQIASWDCLNPDQQENILCRLALAAVEPEVNLIPIEEFRISSQAELSLQVR
ncbi:MAG: replication initiator protein A [Terriglobales bacterium]